MPRSKKPKDSLDELSDSLKVTALRLRVAPSFPNTRGQYETALAELRDVRTKLQEQIEAVCDLLNTMRINDDKEIPNPNDKELARSRRRVRGSLRTKSAP